MAENLIDKVEKAKKNLPYEFVAIKNQSEKIKRVDLNKYDKNLYTGKLFCSLYGVNPLFVGNTHKEIKIGKGKNEIKYTKVNFLKVNEKSVISSHTLKGAISNFLIAHIGSPMTKVEKKGFLFRSNIAFNGKNIKVSVGIVESLNDSNGIKIKKVDAPYIFYYDNKNEIKLNKEYMLNDLKKIFSTIIINLDDDKEKIKTSKFKFFNYNNGLDNKGTFQKLFNTGNKSHNFLGLSVGNIENSRNYFYISDDTQKGFEKTIDFLKEYHIKGHPLIKKDNDKKNIENNIGSLSKKLKKGDIIFFEYKNGNNKVLTFGRTYYYPWAYKRELIKSDFEKDIGYLKDEFKNDEISVLRDMFGYVLEEDKGILSEKQIEFIKNNKKHSEKNAKSGKVHFNYAVIENENEIEKKSFLFPMPGTPKPSAYEFYLKQDENKNGNFPLITYGDPARKDYTEEVRLRGRKFYNKVLEINKKFEYSGNKQDIQKDNVLLDEVLMGRINNPVKFKFTVNFENLTKEQLELLVFALNLNEKKGFNEDTLYHQIGYGKNYGMGAVKIEIDKGFIIRLDGKEINKETYDKIKGLKDGVKSKRNKIDKNFKEILRIHKTKFHYPFGGKTKDIKGWHSEIRKSDLQVRRGRKPKGNPRSKIKDIIESYDKNKEQNKKMNSLRNTENLSSDKLLKGTIKWFNKEKGYGFIEPENGKDIFFHHSVIIGSEKKYLTQGQKVILYVVKGKKGPIAKRVTIL